MSNHFLRSIRVFNYYYINYITCSLVNYLSTYLNIFEHFLKYFNVPTCRDVQAENKINEKTSNVCMSFKLYSN